MNTNIGVRKPLDEDRWVYIWANGIYSGLRSEKDKLCDLVIIGVNERGQKQFLAIEYGLRESTQSWREVPLKLKIRGINIPQLAIGDCAILNLPLVLLGTEPEELKDISIVKGVAAHDV